MREIIVSEWMTLDGVFDGDTMEKWFMPFNSVEREAYIRESILACDAIVIGRTTYEMLAPYWSVLKNDEMGIADKMNSVSKYVVSSTLKKAEWNNSTIISKNAAEEISKLKQQPGTDILITGSATLVHSLMQTDLIDEYRFLIHPVIVSNGKHFFKEGMHTPGMKLVKAKTFGSGVMLLCYQPLKN
jgi:dihydrofolate reductase